jgi:hypothetical protein
MWDDNGRTNFDGIIGGAELTIVSLSYLRSIYKEQ